MSLAAKLIPVLTGGGGRMAPKDAGGGDAELSVNDGGGAMAAPAVKKQLNIRYKNAKLKNTAKYK